MEDFWAKYEEIQNFASVISFSVFTEIGSFFKKTKAL